MQPAYAEHHEPHTDDSQAVSTDVTPHENHGDAGHETSHSDTSDTATMSTEHHGDHDMKNTDTHGVPDTHTEAGHVDTEHGATAATGHDVTGTTPHASEAHDGGEHGGGHDAHTGYHPPAPFVVPVGNTSVHANTLIATYAVMAIIIGLALAYVRNLKNKPSKKQVFFESMVDLPHSIVKTQISHDTYRYVPLIGTIFLFILVSNWFGLLPWRVIELMGTPFGFEIASPTNDLNTNGAIALIAVASYWFFGIRKKGLAHFKHYIQPIPLLLPLNMMEDVSRPLSLSFRLFGNILGGEIVIGILLFLTAPFIITSVVILPMMVLEVLVGFIQAFIFSILTASYIGAMVADHH